MAVIASLSATLALISAVIVMFWFYHTREFSGDGTIEDTGFWSYPRYHIRFPPISLNEPGEHTFSCRGLPPYPLTFKLMIVGKGQREQLLAVKTTVHLEWSDGAGQTICQAVGPLHDWVVCSSVVEDYYWHKNSRDITVRRGRQYRLRMIVKDVDADSPPLSVEPMLVGGGNELP